MKFDVISIIYLVIIGISIIVGLKKGFFKSLINFIKGIVSVVVALIFSKPLATLLNKGSLGDAISGKFLDFFENQGSIFTTAITEETKGDVLSIALKELNIPDVLNSFISKFVSNFIHVDTETTVADALAPTLSYYILFALSFIILFIVVRLLINLLNKVFALLEEIPFVGFVNKLLGGVLNGFMGVVLVCFISYLFTLVVPLGGSFAEWLEQTMCLNDDTVVSVSKFFYEKNFVLAIIALFQK